MGGHLSQRCYLGLSAALLLPAPVASADGANSSQDVSHCWRDGFTADLCCRQDTLLNCWDAVFTYKTCCPTDPAPAVPAAAVPSAFDGDSSCWGGGYTFERCCKVPSVVAAAGGCWDLAYTELRCCGRGPSSSSSSTPVENNGDQAEFLRREGARRWPKYFRKAHLLLDAVGSRSKDAVQVYHNIYEVVNQVIGGVQLASEAEKGTIEAETGTIALKPGAALRGAFLSAATVLARLEEVSKGTAFEHERFGKQAVAAVALSCRREEFGRDMEERVRWLRRGKKTWRSLLLREIRQRANASNAAYQRSWEMYADDLTEALWRPAAGHAAEEELRHADRSTLNPLEEGAISRSAGKMWQVFSTYVMAKPLKFAFSRPHSACEQLARVVLRKYGDFEESLRNETVRPDEVNNAFFAWQLTHEWEQEDLAGQELWPELYRDSEEFLELKNIAKLACLEYLQQVYDAPISAADLAQLELSIWASVTFPNASIDMGLAFHDHPLALLSGVFYAKAGGGSVAERTPTVFADPRGTASFRYTQRRQMEPAAPFHRLAYAHAQEGLALVFPSWLVHGVPRHEGSAARVTFAFNLHTLQGTTLSSWAKTAL